jgi:serine phosphatase RsbU (regulator of sigma subunit)
MGPGLFAAALSYLTLEIVFLPPENTLRLGWEDAPLAGVYLLAAIVISTLDEKRRRAAETIRRSQERMQIARKIQDRLWPIAPPNLPEFDIAGVSHTAEATGGDYFDFIPMRNRRIGIVMGDVSGHDFGSALLMSEVRAYLRALVLAHDDPGDILTLTNSILVNDTGDETFVTLFFACLDPQNCSLIYAGAGHEGILLRAGRQERLGSTSPPLGLDKDLLVSNAPAIDLEPEEVILLMSDGIYEASSRVGERYGMERAIAVVCGHRDKTAREMLDLLFQKMRAFSDGMLQEDDMTALIVKVKTRAPDDGIQGSSTQLQKGSATYYEIEEGRMLS